MSKTPDAASKAAAKVDKEATDRINVHFTASNAQKLRMYAAYKGTRPSAILNELVAAIDFKMPE